MTSHRIKICLLLSSFIFFWIWQIVQPVLDEYLPSLTIGPHTNLTLPISEVISQYLGVGTLLSGYGLYSALNYGQLSFGMNLAFFLPAFMVASGHGVHVACVTIQVQMTRLDPQYALVYFLHEHWSHNTFLIGFYGLVFLLIWAERNGSKRAKTPTEIRKYNRAPRLLLGPTRVPNDRLAEKLATTPKDAAVRCKSCQGTVLQECNAVTRCNDSVETISIVNHKHKNGTIKHYNNTICRNGILLTTSKRCLPTDSTPDKVLRSRLQTPVKVQAGGRGAGEVGEATTEQGRQTITLISSLIVLWTTRVMPIMMGVYFSIFASLTSTKPLTMLFYVGVVSFQMTMMHKERTIVSFGGLSHILKFWDNEERIVGGCFTKAVLIGLPLMLVDFE